VFDQLRTGDRLKVEFSWSLSFAYCLKDHFPHAIEKTSLGFFVLIKFIIAFSEIFETKRFNFLFYIRFGASLHLK
jgi:hypothetical protein